MSTIESIQALGPHHASLLQTIAALDYAEAAAGQQRVYIGTLNWSLYSIEQDLEELDEKLRIEKQDADDIKKSFSRRLAYKMTGQRAKFEARASKEEREYLEAEEALSRATSQKNTIIELLADAKSALAKYVADAQLHRDLNDQLESLYQQVFGGPTPSFPTEDILENAVSTSQHQNSAAQTALAHEKQVMTCLQNATVSMRSCLANLGEAERASTWDMWGGETIADLTERNALSRAQADVHEVQMFLAQAKQLDSQIQHIGPMEIAEGSIMSDVFFDNIFTDMAFHEKIQDSIAQVNGAERSLAAQVSDAQRRLDAAKQLVEVRSKQLQDDRVRLAEKRKAIFETVGGGITDVHAVQVRRAAPREPEAPLPPYTRRI